MQYCSEITINSKIYLSKLCVTGLISTHISYNKKNANLWTYKLWRYNDINVRILSIIEVAVITYIVLKFTGSFRTKRIIPLSLVAMCMVLYGAREWLSLEVPNI